MHIQFRQGLVTAPTNFLQRNGSAVNLSITAPGYLQAAIADGSADYLHVERSTIAGAWTGPFMSGTDYWLYWDIDRITGMRTFGFTRHAPIESTAPPISPPQDQHWFDVFNNKMWVWNSSASKWIHKLRVFAAKYVNATTFVSVSINSPTFTGTQIGCLTNTPIDIGSLIFDVNGAPIKRGNGVFFTTTDVVSASVASTSRVRVGAVLLEATAQGHIPAYGVVRFSNFNEVTLATGLTRYESVYGLVETQASAGEIVNVVTDGIVSNPMWDWSEVGVNTPLYVGFYGELTPDRPIDGVEVGAVVGINTVLIRPLVQVVSTGIGELTQGDPGPTGPQGPQGPQGTAGPQGEPGNVNQIELSVDPTLIFENSLV